MKEIRTFKDEDTTLEVEFDPVELTKFKEKIISEMSVVDHYMTESPEPSYYSPKYNPDIKKRKDIQIRNYNEWHRPWIDVWELYCSSYDRYVIPYIARLIDDLLKGDIKAITDIKELNYGKEYIPIRQTIEEYTKIIVDYKKYHTEFPTIPLCHKEEARVAEKNIIKYIEIIKDDSYAEKFRNYYETVSQMISVRELKAEQTLAKGKPGPKRKLVPQKQAKR